jgi:3-hydroxybutyryl-CoA dehydratase
MKTKNDFKVGETFELTRECDQYRPIYYAAASGDFNPIHIDTEAGRKAGFPGAILQGMCTMAWLADACVAYLDDPGRIRSLKVRFSKPVNMGDRVTFLGKCVAIEGDRLRLEISAKNQNGDDVLKAVVAEAVI